jgi:hypothetical protein
MPPAVSAHHAGAKRLTADERLELAREVLGACMALARRHGEETVVSNRPITEVLVGGFLIWFTEWDSEVSGL